MYSTQSDSKLQSYDKLATQAHVLRKKCSSSPQMATITGTFDTTA